MKKQSGFTTGETAAIICIILLIVGAATVATIRGVAERNKSPLDSVTTQSAPGIYEIIEDPREIGDATNLAAIAVNQLDKGVKSEITIAMLAPSGKFKKGDRVTASRIQYAERMGFNTVALYFARDLAPEKAEK